MAVAQQDLIGLWRDGDELVVAANQCQFPQCCLRTGTMKRLIQHKMLIGKGFESKTVNPLFSWAAFVEGLQGNTLEIEKKMNESR